MNIKIENPIKIKGNYKLINYQNNKNANTNGNINFNNLEEEGEEREENENNTDDLNIYDYENSNNLNNYSFLKFLKFDLKRKIKACDISWESEEFDINNPYFTSEDEKNEDSEKDENEVSEYSCEDIINYDDIHMINDIQISNYREENNLISTFENLNLNNLNYLKSDIDKYKRNKKIDLMYSDSNRISNSNLFNNQAVNLNEKKKGAYSNKKNSNKILVTKSNMKDKNNKKKDNNNKKEKIDLNEILAEVNRLKLKSDSSQNNFNFINNYKNEKININEELNFSNNCNPHKTIVYISEILSSENISLMQNVSEINHDNMVSNNNKKQEMDNSEDRNININDYSFSRINSVNHSYNISSFMKKASNQTIETINKNSKNGFYSKQIIFILNILFSI